MQRCTLCGEEKPLTDFYRNKLMTTGFAKQCKPCVKDRARLRRNRLKKIPDWIKKERARHREKYHRLGYREKHKPSYESKRKIMERYNEKYPEKAVSKTGSGRLRKAYSIPQTIELHHWSYDYGKREDVICLSRKDHALIHRFLFYDQPNKAYKDPAGNLLDTREKHIAFISQFVECIDITTFEKRRAA